MLLDAQPGPNAEQRDPPMDVIRLRALRGPNLWSRHTAIEALVRCPPGETISPAFEARVRAL